MGRTLLAGFATLALVSAPATAQNMRPRDVDALPVSEPRLVQFYGDDQLQRGELRLPLGKGPFPVAVVIHGGCWTKGFATLRNTAPLASALTKRGIATWNIEYRQAGDAGGGWPGTFQDWAAATDYLRVLARTQSIDLNRVVVIGHSAGAHGALWIASRARLPASSQVRGPDPLPIRAVVAIDGPQDLRPFVGPDSEICGKPVIAPFMGGAPKDQSARYIEADASERLPLNVGQYFVASVVLQPDIAEGYRSRAAAAGDKTEVLDAQNGGHFDIIAPGSAAWPAVEAFILSRAFPDAKTP